MSDSISLFGDIEKFIDLKPNDSTLLYLQQLESISKDKSVKAVPIDNISWEDFSHEIFTKRYRNHFPVIIKNGARNWNCTKEWQNIENFISCSEDIENDVLISKDGKNFLKHELCHSISMNSHHALFSILSKSMPTEKNDEKKYCRLYLDRHPMMVEKFQLEYLRELISLDKTEAICNHKNIGIWVSSNGCVTPLHFDVCHGFLTQIVGKKTFILVEPNDSSFLYWRNKNYCELMDYRTTRNASTSGIDLTSWLEYGLKERERYPLLKEVTWRIAHLEAGDILYTPPGWWHHVTSDTASVSLLVPFDPLPGYDALPFNVAQL